MDPAEVGQRAVMINFKTSVVQTRYSVVRRRECLYVHISVSKENNPIYLLNFILFEIPHGNCRGILSKTALNRYTLSTNSADDKLMILFFLFFQENRLCDFKQIV